MNHKIRIIFKVLIIIILVVLSIIIMLNQLINWNSGKYIYNNIDELPENNVALVLGTSKYRKDGSANPYFYNRINATIELYENNKVNYIIVSGDNRSRYYNEPGFMRLELLKNGIPDKVIYLDYAGFRTYDSVIRCYEIFGQQSFTIVSQKFHNQRAVYIARSKNINAIAYNAEDISFKEGFRIQLREIFAKVKVFFDILTDKQPKFLGEPVKVGY